MGERRGNIEGERGEENEMRQGWTERERRKKRVNVLMVSGKKSTSRQNLKEASRALREGLKKGEYKTREGVVLELASDAFEEAIHRLSPSVKLSSVKRGGSTMKIPVLLMGNRSSRLGIRFLVEGAVARARNGGVPISRAMAMEVHSVLKNQDCHSLTRYRRLQKEAKANRMFVR